MSYDEHLQQLRDTVETQQTQVTVEILEKVDCVVTKLEEEKAFLTKEKKSFQQRVDEFQREKEMMMDINAKDSGVCLYTVCVCSVV
jgi:hypothetical protein